MNFITIPLSLTCQEMPALFEKLMPTLKEILNTAADGAKVDDKKYATWGKALMESGGPFIRFIFVFCLWFLVFIYLFVCICLCLLAVWLVSEKKFSKWGRTLMEAWGPNVSLAALMGSLKGTTLIFFKKKKKKSILTCNESAPIFPLPYIKIC